MEMLIAVPYKLALNYAKALECSEISNIVNENPDLFGEPRKREKDVILTMFLMYEW
jgi:hypothetical protein